jgi:hypothetical protein
MTDDLTILPRNNSPARPRSPKSALALIEHAATEVVGPLVAIDRMLGLLPDLYLGQGAVTPGRFLKEAVQVHRTGLPRFASGKQAYSQLFGVCVMPPARPITQPTALKMIGVAFAGLTKRKDAGGDAALQLAAAADMFSPVTAALGHTTGLWKPVSQHPAILALAVKHLLATSVFAPAPSEIRQAMDEVHARLSMQTGRCDKALDLIGRADEIIFVSDRAKWDAAWANVGHDVVAALLEYIDEEGLRQAKQAELVREAACTAKPAKRTHKPKPKGLDDAGPRGG